MATDPTDSPEEIAEKRIDNWLRECRKLAYKAKEINDEGYDPSMLVLDLSNIGLKTLPHLPSRNLVRLDLSNNQFTELPDWIGGYSNLGGLELEGCYLRKLPTTIGDLKELNGLGLRDNNLEELPKELRELPLKILDLRGNPKLGIQESILRSGRPKEILEYYFKAAGEKGEPLRELKLLLVGRGKAGKTTIVKRLAGEPPNPNEPETHSIVIRELFFKCKEGRVRTRAWDLGGQEFLYSTHQFFLTERSLYLLVLEPRTGLAPSDAEYWLKLIETQGGKSPVIIVLNYSDDRTWSVDKVKLRRKYPFIVDFISTDALTGYGIEELNYTIRSTVQNKLPDVWKPFPKAWHEVKNVVAGMGNNFLTYKEYTQICSRGGVADSAEQKTLARILNYLGLALYYGDDPRLYDTRVLNPGWVTGGVYAIIRSKFVAEKSGQLSVNDMPMVLLGAEKLGIIKTVDYPSETHNFILELMRAFQLCFGNEEENLEIENKVQPLKYLVPDLLQEFEPEMEEAWEEAPVRLRYRYEILFPGLISQFTVRTSELSEGLHRWKQGVVLSHAEAKALVRVEPDHRELHVYIIGINEGSRLVMATIVRNELEALHKDIFVQGSEELELTGSENKWIGVEALQEVELSETPILKLPVQPKGTEEVNVSLELNKLLPEAIRTKDRPKVIARRPVEIFVCFAKEDEKKIKTLDLVLDVLVQHEDINWWRASRLIPGQNWDEEILQHLETMDIFLFIASHNSLVSSYIRDPELRRAQERYLAGNIEVVPVKIGSCACDEDPFLGKFQRLVSDLPPIAEFHKKEFAWDEVRKELIPLIHRVRENKEADLEE